MIASKIRKALLLCLLGTTLGSAAPPREKLRALPDSARWIGAEEIALALFAYTLVPLWVGVGAASLLSPTLVLEQSGAHQHRGWALGTGIGWSSQRSPWRFSHLRLQGEWEVLAKERRLQLILLGDWNALPVLFPEGFRLGGSLGIGSELPIARRRFTVQTELWLRNAMGIWYLGMFPQHSLGVRFRYTLASAAAPARWQVAFGYWSTFVW
jgi:hypothetical protein